MRRLLALLLALVAMAAAAPAWGHAMRTAYVDVVERGDGRVAVKVTSGATYGDLRLVMPEGCTAPARGAATWTCDRPLAGRALRVDGLGGVTSDAVVSVTFADGASASQLLRPGSSSWTVPDRPSATEALGRYARAGFFHVLAGLDHLLFLVALVALLRRFRSVLLAETAFTVSHSVAFAATALGVVHVPQAAAEAAIALSLVLVALGVGKERVRPARGAIAAFVFGAVHGLGFAGGLTELGVPRGAVAPAIAGFAVGVEVAQVAFLLVCFALFALASRVAMARRLATVTAYVVGVTGFFWLVERVLPLVRGV
ncbi:MAG: HupE/UreJ family protein [Myxococcales bacterium]|nr:HupE/UreJ family protein [Myxococcales bacterium]